MPENYHRDPPPSSPFSVVSPELPWREHYEFVREFPSDRDPAIGLAAYRLKTPR